MNGEAPRLRSERERERWRRGTQKKKGAIRSGGGSALQWYLSPLEIGDLAARLRESVTYLLHQPRRDWPDVSTTEKRFPTTIQNTNLCCHPSTRPDT